MEREGEQIEQLVEGCRNKDRRAQEQLYRNYYRALMSLCVRYTGNEEDAMDVLNTGFFKVFENIDKYDSKKGALYTWMRTIIVNTCLTHIRAKSSRIEPRELDHAVHIDIEPDILSHMSSADILKMVRQLPPATQAVFNLFVMDGYMHKEIAAMMGISENTSKWHLSEARKMLQELITKHRMDK